MKIGPFGNHVLGPGFPVDISAFAGEGKFVTFHSTELTTGELEQDNKVDYVVTTAGFPNIAREVMQANQQRKVIAKFLLTPNADGTRMHKIKDWGLIMGDGHEFDLKAWDKSKYTLWAEIEVHTPELSYLPMVGDRHQIFIKIIA